MSVTKEMVFIHCPTCHKDIPSNDLSNFVRFYDKDVGFATCPHCGKKITWQFRLLDE